MRGSTTLAKHVTGLLLGLAGMTGWVTLQADKAFPAEFKIPGDFSNIQAALDAAVPGDTILVEPGLFIGSLRFNGISVSVRSTGGPEVTTIEGDGGATVDIGPGGELIGFKITGGAAFFGAGTEVHGIGSLIKGNIFDGNVAFNGGFGAGIGGNSSSPTIEQNIFRDNTCDNQFLAGVITFINISSPRIINNIFENNLCRAINMTLPVGNTPEVINNTMVNNRVGVRVNRISTALQIYRNNIIVGNEIGLEIDFGSEINNPTWENNLVFNNDIDYDGISDQTGINGNISADPLFVDITNGDFHLTSGSPAIDAGTNVGAPTTDFDGNPRPIDGNGDGVAIVDMGAFEFAEFTTVLDHFLCYEAEGDDVEVMVDLEDQFGAEPDVEVKEPELFCNPVAKTVGGEVTEIGDPTAHLTGYEIEAGEEVERVVVVANQFGEEQTLSVEEPELIFVPSEKDGVDSDLNLDHFKCYETEGDSVNVTVVLEDQFGVEPEVRVKESELFCNPVDKNGEEIFDPTAHLTCYEIEGNGEESEREVLVGNQFGEQVLEVEEPEILCVPSEKLDVQLLGDDGNGEDDD